MLLPKGLAQLAAQQVTESVMTLGDLELPKSFLFHREWHSHKNQRPPPASFVEWEPEQSLCNIKSCHFLGQVFVTQTSSTQFFPQGAHRKDLGVQILLAGYFPSLRKPFPASMCIHNAYIFLNLALSQAPLINDLNKSMYRSL